MFSPSKLFSPSKESVVALSGTPLKSPSTKSSRKNKIIIEFPREWPEQSKRNNGNGHHRQNNYPRNGDVVGEPFHSIFEHEFHARQEHQQHQHRFCAPFLLGMAVALVVIFIPSTAGVYWICQDVDVLSSSSLESSSSTSCVKVTTTTTTFMRPTPPTPAKRRYNFFKRLFSKEKSSPSSVVAVTKALPALPQQDPTTCACQLVWQGVERVGQLVSLGARNNNNGNGPYPDQKCQGLDSTQRSPTTEGEGSLPSKTPKQHSQEASRSTSLRELKETYRTAYTAAYLPIPHPHQELIIRMAKVVRDQIPNWDRRVEHVPWGGPTALPTNNAAADAAWFVPSFANAKMTTTKTKTTSDSTKPSNLQALDGGALFYSYLRVMDWPSNWKTHFPGKLCAKKGCSLDEALQHTLQWREQYQPWMIPPTMKHENQMGAIYCHGFSPPLTDENENAGARHAIVWARPGFRFSHDKKKNHKHQSHSDAMYIRAYMNTLDRAVAASLNESQGRVGKFNFVVDGSNFQWFALPSIHYIKVFVTMLQDHFPDRLGIILLTNIGFVGEFAVKVFLPMISKEVRNKLIVIPHDPLKRHEVLEAILGVENIPVSLGGTDTFQFQVDEYYDAKQFKDYFVTDQQAMEYVTSMPYHA